MPIWLVACKGMFLLLGSRPMAASDVRCVASVCPRAMPSTLHVDRRPELRQELQLEYHVVGLLWAYLPLANFKLAARPPFAMCHQQPDRFGAKS